MQATVTVTPTQLPEVLLRVATVRPVHIWGAPGIGKSTLVASFAAELGLECVALLGTQLAPEDISGVPQIVTRVAGVARSPFAPPEVIARPEAYVHTPPRTRPGRACGALRRRAVRRRLPRA